MNKIKKIEFDIDINNSDEIIDLYRNLINNNFIAEYETINNNNNNEIYEMLNQEAEYSLFDKTISGNLGYILILCNQHKIRKLALYHIIEYKKFYINNNKENIL